MPAIPAPCLAAITDRTLLSPNWTLAQAIAPAVTGGINFVIFREGELPLSARQNLWEFTRDGVRGRAPIITSDSPQFARDVGAEGVHLEGDASVHDARAIVGPDSYVGVTIRDPGHALSAASEGANYGLDVLDWSQPESALGLLRAICSGTSLSIIAGVDMPVDSVADCLRAGAAGVAVCTAAMSAYDRTAAAKSYWDALQG